MRWFLFFFLLISLCAGPAGLCSAADTLPAGLPAGTLPEALSDTLKELGIDAGRFQPLQADRGEERLFFYKAPLSDYKIILRLRPDGTGVMIVTSAAGPLQKDAALIFFDSRRGTYRAQAISPECLQQIAGTAQSLLLAIYGCALSFDARTCVTNVTEFIEDIALIGSACDNKYILSIAAQNGTVTIDPEKEFYRYKEEVTLTAIPATGYSFSSWAGSVFGSDNPTIVSMDADKNVTANFTINEYTLSISAQNGTVARIPNRSVYSYGDQVILTATPNTGYELTSWSGDLSGSENPVTITMDADKNITANFEEENYTVTILALNGTVIKNPDKSTYTYGEKVVLTAVADSGYSFFFWSGDLSGRGNPETITVESDMDITANFSEDAE